MRRVQPRPRRPALLIAAAAVLVVAGCSSDGNPKSPIVSPLSSHTATSTPTTAPPAGSSTEPSQPSQPTETERPRRPLRGIDVSHHQGAIDWAAVADDRVRFAYLKATEGTAFTDPRYDENRAGARAAGLRVGGYHYFSLCTPGAAQGAHFADVLGRLGGRRHLPPVVDLELAGSCSNPPARADLLAEVRSFIDVVEQRTGRPVVVYAFPDFEARYGFAADIDRRQWVRRLGDRPPARDWWMWQHSQTGTVDGIGGPVDLDRLRR